MIPYVLRLARWEWFKQRRRWLPWVLLALFMVIPLAAFWGGFASSQFQDNEGVGFTFSSGRGQEPIYITCEDILSGDAADVPQAISPEMLSDYERICTQDLYNANEYDRIALPSSLSNAVQAGSSFAWLLVIILTASVLGTEYAWGTLRNVLARGTGRWQFLAGKGALLVLLSLAGMLILTALTAVSSLIATAIVDAPPGYASSETWPGLLAVLGRAWFAVVPYIALSAFATVISGSSNMGQGLAFGYYFVELTVSAILSNLFDWFDTIGDYLLGQNISAWLSASGNSEGLTFSVGRESPTGELHAALVLAAYIVGLSGLALWRFSRRDVGGASGG